MSENIKFLVTAGINQSTSVAEINRSITALQKQVKTLNLKINADPTVLKTLNRFSEQMKRLSADAFNAKKHIEETINPDGSRFKRTLFADGTFTEAEQGAKKVGEQLKQNSNTSKQAHASAMQQEKQLQYEHRVRHTMQKNMAKDQQKALLDQQKLEQRVNAYRHQRLNEAKVFNAQQGANMNDQTRRQFEGYVSSVRALNADTPKAVEQMRRLDRGFKDVQTQARLASVEMRNAAASTQGFGSILLKIPLWVAGMTAIYAPLRGFQDMMRQIIEIDTQMTALRRVSGGEIQQDHILQVSIEMAEKLGNQIGQINEGLTNFARQGFRGTELESMVEAATLFSNISEMNVDEAADGLTSIVNGFQMLPTEVMKSVDAVNEVDEHLSLILAIV